MTQLIKTLLFIKDLEYWKKQNPKMLKKIQNICSDIIVHPFEGLGKPEPLKYQFGGVWSRRIDRKNRLLYMIVNDNTIKLISCYGHYD